MHTTSDPVAAPLPESAAHPETGGQTEAARQWRSTATENSSRGPGGPGRLALARSRRLRQGGKTVLLWVVVFYVVLQVVFSYLMESQRPLWAETWRAKWPRLLEVAASDTDRPLLVTLGSSRTDCGVQAGRLAELPGPNGKPYRAFNFGVPVAGPLCQLLHLRAMLDAGIHPDLLLVEVLPPFFNETAKGGMTEDVWPLALWATLPEMLRLRPYFTDPGEKLRNWLETHLAVCYVFRSHLQTRLHEVLYQEPLYVADTAHDSWGYKLPTTFTPEQIEANRAMIRRMFRKGLRHFEVARKPSQALIDLLTLCRQEHIRVVLVLMPESSSFRGWYASEGRAQMQRLLTGLSATYRVPVIDASCWMRDEDFSDYHHLQEWGAAQFTERLRTQLQALRPSLDERRGSLPLSERRARPSG